MVGVRPRLSRRAIYCLAGLGALLLVATGLLAALPHLSSVRRVYLGSYDEYLLDVLIPSIAVSVLALGSCAWVAYPIGWIIWRILPTAKKPRPKPRFLLKRWLGVGLFLFLCSLGCPVILVGRASRPEPIDVELKLSHFDESYGSLTRTISVGQVAIIKAELSVYEPRFEKGPHHRLFQGTSDLTATAKFVGPSFDISSASPPSQIVRPHSPANWVFSVVAKERSIGPQEIAVDVTVEEREGGVVKHISREATITVLNGIGIPTWSLALSALLGAGFFVPLVALAWSRRRDAMAATGPQQPPATASAPAGPGTTFHINIQNSTLGSAAFGAGATATGSVTAGSAGSATDSPTGASAPTPASNPTVDWDVSNRTRARITELLKDAQPHLGARKSHTWGSTLSGTKIPVWLIQGADKILRQDEGVSVSGFYETPAEVCDALHGDVFMSYLAACSKYLMQVTQAGTHYQYMPPAEFEHRVNTILAGDDGFAHRATLRDGQWLPTNRSETAKAALQSIYLSYGPADEPFVERLYHALEARGVATFYFPQHAPSGQKLGRVARVGVNQHDRVLLVCSRASLGDPRVQNDLEQTLEREAREGGSSRLILVNLDNFARSSERQPPHPDVIHEIQGRVMVEMVGAERDARKFEQGIEKLIRALKG